ncbi:MAG: lytic transglycosylase domain-containing protein [Desulfobacterales bacterium]|nr:lytic transglycosylase domain-containing protein [Desulfobacterales bacterium]
MMRILTLQLAMAVLLGAALTGSVRAEIYTYVDENGVRHFSNAPTSQRYRYAGPEIEDRIAYYSSTDTFDHYIRDAASLHGLDFALVKAVVQAESNFNPNAVSKAGAIGLMQIMPGNLAAFRLHDPYDPRANILAGTRYLKSLIKKFNHDLTLSLAAYNAGPAAVERYNGVPPYPETQKYVKRVMAYYNRYKNSE